MISEENSRLFFIKKLVLGDRSPYVGRLLENGSTAIETIKLFSKKKKINQTKLKYKPFSQNDPENPLGHLHRYPIIALNHNEDSSIFSQIPPF